MFLEKFPYRVKFYTKMKLGCEGHIQKVHRAQRGRFLRWTGPKAGGFLSLTGPSAPRVVVAASPQFLKGGAASAAGCVEGLHRFAQGATAALPLRVMVAPFGRRF